MESDKNAATNAEAAGAVAAVAAAVGGMFGPFGGGFVPPPVAMSFFHVLTVADAAQFLRVPEPVVTAEAEAGRLPGRKLGTEWRFLEFALAEWLRTGQQLKPEPKPKSSKERMLAIAGLWKDDPTVDAMVEEIYRKRKADPVGGK